MEIPGPVRERLGEEEIRAGVNLGDEDAVCLTPTRTLVYRGEGLLSDESVSVLSHDVDRIDVTEGRRKTTFELTYVEGTKSFSVPKGRGEKVLELLIEGVLRVAGLTGAEESVHGVYRFSELTLILTDERLVKHVGSSVWDEDFEEFPYADVTHLDFEEGSVATQIVLTVDGRPQRIKAPNDDAPMLRQTLEQAIFAYHGVDSLAALNEAVGSNEGDEDADETGPRPMDLTLDEGIDPLVGGGGEDSVTAPPESEQPTEPDGTVQAESPTPSSAPGEAVGTDAGARDVTPTATPKEGAKDSTTDTDARSVAPAGGDTASAADPQAVSHEDLDEIDAQLDALRTAVTKQNKLLRKQQQTIKQLVEELRQGR